MQDWKIYRYQQSSERIKQLIDSQLPKQQYQETIVRSIYEPAKFSLPGKYEVTQVLGKGSYGTVCCAKDKKNQYSVAIKKITNIFYREVLLKRAIRELKFINFFAGHKNIVSLIDIELVTEKPYDGLYCYQELIDYDLAKVIHSSVQLTEFHIKSFFYQIVCGLKYIHSADVIHRDLKPGNILCTINGTLKICDFGLARGISTKYKVGPNGQLEITNYVATRWYRAPELILSTKSYDKSIDMWSVGCILAEFYGRKPKFMGKDSMHQIFEIIKVLGSPSVNLLNSYGSVKAWNLTNTSTILNQRKTSWKIVYPHASDDAVDLMNKLVQWKATKRLTCEETLCHPFLSDVRHPDDEPICDKGPFNFTYENNLTSMQRLREYLLNEVALFKEQKFSHSVSLSNSNANSNLNLWKNVTVIDNSISE